MTSADLRIGIDVGGTNTDAVVLDGSKEPVARTKVPTTLDITGGINHALREVLSAPAVRAERIGHVMVGTTHATNAVLQRRGLRRVAAIRIGAPSSTCIRPMFGWPDDLHRVISAGGRIVAGGMELDGGEIVPFDADAVARFCGEVAGTAEAVAVTSVFAPVSPAHEQLAAEVIQRELGDIPISLSHEVGSLGLLERENATILNAALGRVAANIIEAIEEALDAHDLGHAVPFFAQNDGTLMSLAFTERTPVLTIGSGPANSLRGAAFLSGQENALVADVGGTSTDIGALMTSFPRESAFGVEVGGVRTNFRMPDLVSIAIGGGTVVREGDRGAALVGPDSVGYQLDRDALVFGGDVATLSDAAVAAGRAEMGGAPPPAHAGDLLGAALAEADRQMADAIDRIKVTRGDLPLIAVGGGSVLIPDRVPGVTEVIRPAHYDVANAIGAAIGTVSGQIDRIYAVGYGERSRAKAVETARQAAIDNAVSAGADAGAVKIVEIDEIPLAYLREPAVRLRVKAAGPLSKV
ncbi:hydantoinase/oxoprolinase N-terminal domain-containing protein [Marinitenerispora sediminis]|uniref:Hydantoinase subunit beta n=1 Tax=Marinitenerispora sediminis TaxID=1931232 RepID=A0A368T6C0_9ACTN|nr:hydantoinase/oxoprolinase family protein [Marinitenerispora sediminis]RCV55365.1 hydantoinase subunit beta [Marinitenerispora sediminis]RCV59156.1 hydantoinase subunit beta [Marinitenerispora sediminis]RCV59182.1 hydantoinase subunit beta [Marinitenerispora sediminis]